jgi:N6-adenosine-specific RNA methylase IME4
MPDANPPIAIVSRAVHDESTLEAFPGSPIFAPLPMIAGGWACVACDAPLPKGQGRAPSRHYRTHSLELIITLQLQTVLADDAWLWLWWPDPHLQRLTEVMRALGFEYSGKGFTWIKTLKSLAPGPRWISTEEIEAMLHMGSGLTTRKDSKTCWLGRRGKPAKLSKSVREVIVAPRREHMPRDGAMILSDVRAPPPTAACEACGPRGT